MFAILHYRYHITNLNSLFITYFKKINIFYFASFRIIISYHNRIIKYNGGEINMNIYDLLNETEESQSEHYFDSFTHFFNQSNRNKLMDPSDLEIFDLFTTAYRIRIFYRSNQRDKLEYQINNNDNNSLTPFTDKELSLFNNLNWNKLPNNIKAHIYDVIWLCNKDYKAAINAAETYYTLYDKTFNEEHWVQCINYISRALELSIKIGNVDKQYLFLKRIHDNVVLLNGNDSSFLSINLIDLLLKHNYDCDFSTLIPYSDKLISKNKVSISKNNILEKAYYMKANLYNKLGDTLNANKVYIQYADYLLEEAKVLLTDYSDNNDDIDNSNRNFFIIDMSIKKAINLYRNHGAQKKAADTYKYLIDIQKNTFHHLQMHKFEFDVSKFYKLLEDDYGNHSISELIWDVIFVFNFQDKKKIRNEVTTNPSLSSLCDNIFLGNENQTEFVLPGLCLDNEDNVLLHMYNQSKIYEDLQGNTLGQWFIHRFKNLELKESDLDIIFDNNPIIPKGQGKNIQKGVYYGLIGKMPDSLYLLCPLVENIFRNLADMCGDDMTYYDSKMGIQQKKVLSQVFIGENLNECVEENILFTFNGLLQQKSGSNIRNRITHGLITDAECYSGDCIYFVMVVLRFCALQCGFFRDEIRKRIQTKKCTK